LRALTAPRGTLDIVIPAYITEGGPPFLRMKLKGLAGAYLNGTGEVGGGEHAAAVIDDFFSFCSLKIFLAY